MCELKNVEVSHRRYHTRSVYKVRYSHWNVPQRVFNFVKGKMCTQTDHHEHRCCSDELGLKLCGVLCFSTEKIIIILIMHVFPPRFSYVLHRVNN